MNYRSVNNLLEEIRLDLMEDAPHDRCPNGSHWNDKHRKCEQLPGAVSRKSMTAHVASQRLGMDPKGGGSPYPDFGDEEGDAAGHGKAYLAHRNTKKWHKNAAKAAHTAGFSPLATHHNNMAAQHQKKMAHHASLSNPKLISKLSKGDAGSWSPE